MQVIRHALGAAALMLVVCWSATIHADDSLLSKLNPFGSSTSTPQRPPAPSGSVMARKQAPPSLMGRTMKKIGDTTKGTWDATKRTWHKTTDFLSPSHLFSTSSKPAQPASQQKTVGEFLNLPRAMP